MLIPLNAPDENPFWLCEDTPLGMLNCVVPSKPEPPAPMLSPKSMVTIWPGVAEAKLRLICWLSLTASSAPSVLKTSSPLPTSTLTPGCVGLSSSP
jgi:hypothetical protein